MREMMDETDTYFYSYSKRIVYLGKSANIDAAKQAVSRFTGGAASE